MASSQTPETSFAVGDELGFVALISVNTGAIESVRDGRLSMSLRELSDVNFSAASEPVTLRYLASDLPDEADLSGRRDVLELLATNASKAPKATRSPILRAVTNRLEPMLQPFPHCTRTREPGAREQSRTFRPP